MSKCIDDSNCSELLVKAADDYIKRIKRGEDENYEFRRFEKIGGGILENIFARVTEASGLTHEQHLIFEKAQLYFQLWRFRSLYPQNNELMNQQISAFDNHIKITGHDIHKGRSPEMTTSYRVDSIMGRASDCDLC